MNTQYAARLARRSAEGESVTCLFNFSEYRQQAWLGEREVWLEPYEMKRV